MPYPFPRLRPLLVQLSPIGELLAWTRTRNPEAKHETQLSPNLRVLFRARQEPDLEDLVKVRGSIRSQCKPLERCISFGQI